MGALMLLCGLLLPSALLAQAAPTQPAGAAVSKLMPGVPAMQVKTNPDGSQDYTVTLQILAVMTILTLLPSFLMTMTAFTRIVIVLAILRQALGLQSTPSNQILMGLALFLTIFIMLPTLTRVNEEALTPYMSEQVTSVEALQLASRPFHEFMLKQTRESDIALFMRISKTPDVQTPQELPFFILAPAFLTSELKTAFQIGFVLFIPFLIIDLVVASVLMAMGMMMLSPVIISLPFKIMLFVLVDGWALIIGSLASSFG
jgi:flagellar biosynthesis protein FliP